MVKTTNIKDLRGEIDLDGWDLPDLGDFAEQLQQACKSAMKTIFKELIAQQGVSLQTWKEGLSIGFPYPTDDGEDEIWWRIPWKDLAQDSIDGWDKPGLEAVADGYREVLRLIEQAIAAAPAK